MSTDYGAELENNLVLNNLMATPPGATEQGHHHPFLSLKVLHEVLGDAGTISFSTLSE